jgi:hypothetical protein
VKKITVVGVREGKRVVHWPGFFVAFALMWIASSAAAWLVDGIASSYLGTEGSRSLGGAIRKAFVLTAVLLPIFVVKLRSMPVARLPELAPRR